MLLFHQEFWKTLGKSSPNNDEDGDIEDDDSSVEAETPSVSAIMPSNYFPPLWLVFVAFGNFRDTRISFSKGCENGASRPLSESVNNRSAVRALGSAERKLIEDDNSASTSKKRKAEVLA